MAEAVAQPAAVGFETERAPTAGSAPEAAPPVGSDACRDHLANLVVLGALRGIAEDVVGRGDLLESLLRLGVPGIRVGVVLLGELLEGARQVLVGRARRHAEDLVVVLLEPLSLGCHYGFFLVTFTIAGRSTRPFSFHPVRN